MCALAKSAKPESSRHKLAEFARSGALRSAVEGKIDGASAALLVRIISRYCGTAPKGPYRPFGSGHTSFDPTAAWPFPPKGKS